MKVLKLLSVLIFVIPTMLTAQVVINEVLLSSSGDQIELKNLGSSPVNVSGWFFCSRFSYPSIGSMTIISGNLNIPAGGILAVSGFDVNNTSADLGLYLNNNNFGSSSNMVDFVQWGGAGIGRESVAVSKGIWTTGNFVPAVINGHSIEYDGDGDSTSDWFDQVSPTIGFENGVLTSVNEEENGLPGEFSLAQNYPNPFNPSTSISYTIPQSANFTTVRLDIYNVLGQFVRTLVNETQSAGLKRVLWNGRNEAGELVSSGVYIYTLKAGKFADTRKMIFVR